MRRFAGNGRIAASCILSAAQLGPRYGITQRGAVPLIPMCAPAAGLRMSSGKGTFGAREKTHKLRLTEEERRKRLKGKSSDEKRAAADALEEADRFVQQDLADDINALIERTVDAAQSHLARLANPAGALERLEVDFAGAKRPLLQYATIIKVNPKELSITPHEPHHTAMLISRLSRHDPSLAPSKNGEKIRATIEPVTKQRREQTAAAIVELQKSFEGKMKLTRRDAINFVRDLKLSNQNLTHQMEVTIGEICDEKTVEGTSRLQELADEAMNTADDDVVEAQDSV